MDCCGNDETKVKVNKTKMERRIVLWIVIGVLFLVAVVFMFKSGGTGSVVSQGASAVKSAASSGMVGGC